MGQGVSGSLPKTSPIPRRQEQIVPSKAPLRDNIRNGQPQQRDDPVYPSPNGFRIKIGSGMEQTKTVMEGINTALKGGPQPNHALHMNQHHPGPSPDGHKIRNMHGHILHHPHHNSNHHNANPLQTPIKDGRLSSVVSTPSLTGTGGPGSKQRPKYPESGSSTRRLSPTLPLATIPTGRYSTIAVQGEPTNQNMSSGGSRVSKKKEFIPVVGINAKSIKGNKENESLAPRKKRNPCNCKRSKCLKLYCECFAAELFCDGCNCVNCNNTENHGSGD